MDLTSGMQCIQHNSSLQGLEIHGKGFSEFRAIYCDNLLTLRTFIPDISLLLRESGQEFVGGDFAGDGPQVPRVDPLRAAGCKGRTKIISSHVLSP